MNNKELQELSGSIGIPVKQLNRLNRDKWYHGTTKESYRNILQQGIISNYNYGSQLDFGMGFYLTDSMESAGNYMSRVPELNKNGEFIQRQEWCVIEIAFNPFHLLFEEKNAYTFCNFQKHDRRFAEFVFKNRLDNVFNENPHGFDIIWGVMSDSIPQQVILDFKNKKISYETAIARMRKSHSMKQLYIGNQSICDILKITDVRYFKRED